jgi:hypothetical protein
MAMMGTGLSATPTPNDRTCPMASPIHGTVGGRWGSVDHPCGVTTASSGSRYEEVTADVAASARAASTAAMAGGSGGSP